MALDGCIAHTWWCTWTKWWMLGSRTDRGGSLCLSFTLCFASQYYIIPNVVSLFASTLTITEKVRATRRPRLKFIIHRTATAKEMQTRAIQMAAVQEKGESELLKANKSLSVYRKRLKTF